MVSFVSVRFWTIEFACNKFSNGTPSIAGLNGRLHNADAIRKGKSSVIIGEKVAIVSPSRVIFRMAGWQLLS